MIFALLFVGAVALFDLLWPLVLLVGAIADVIGVGFVILVAVLSFCNMIAPESGRRNG